MLKKTFDFLKTKSGAAIVAIVAIFAIAPLLHCMGNAEKWPYWFHEHFFNALQVSSNFLSQGIPSLDALRATNDFSVFWNAVLILISFIAPFGSPVYFTTVCLVLATMPVLSVALMNALLKKMEIPVKPASLFFTNAFFFVLCIRLAETGTDAAWAVPAVMIGALAYLRMLEKPSFFSGMACGLAVLLCVWVRFDTLAFVVSAAFIFYMRFNGKMPVTLKQVFMFLPGFIVGILPAVGWEFLLYRHFGTPVPATVLSWMQAQNMSPWKIFSVLLGSPAKHFLSSPSALICLSFPFIAVIAAVVDSIPWRQERTYTPKDTLFYSLIWFPIIQILFFAFFTHLNLPEYAYYSLAVALPFALMYGINRIDDRMKTDKDREEFAKYRDIIGVLLLFLGVFWAILPRSADLIPQVNAVKSLTANRPGIYAVGNGGGIFSFAAKIPVIRLDGLAADKQMTDFISQQTVLGEVFKHYGVDYYIMRNPVKSQGCYAVREPVENTSGGDNKGMSDWLCAEPVAVKKISNNETLALFALDASGKAVSK